MSYIGQQLPADVFSGFTIDKFTGDGTANKALTLSKAPLGETALLVTIDGVVQEPTDDFTVSGTTLTLVGTAANNSEINVTHLSGTVPSTLASAVDVNGLSDGIILDADADTTIGGGGGGFFVGVWFGFFFFWLFVLFFFFFFATGRLHFGMQQMVHLLPYLELQMEPMMLEL